MWNLCIQPLLREDGGSWSKWNMKECNAGKQLLFKGLFISQIMEQEVGLCATVSLYEYTSRI